MKKLLSVPVIMLLLMTAANGLFAHATPGGNDPSSASSGSVLFSIAIPDQWSSSIIRENADNGVNFRFKKSDGTTVFLFSVNKVTADVWMSVRDQIPNHKILDSKNGMIYYTEFTIKPRIKGDDNATYQQVYAHLGDIINSVKITE